MAPSTATATGPLAAAAIRLVAVGALLDTTITELLDCCSFVASNIRISGQFVGKYLVSDLTFVVLMRMY